MVMCRLIMKLTFIYPWLLRRSCIYQTSIEDSCFCFLINPINTQDNRLMHLYRLVAVGRTGIYQSLTHPRCRQVWVNDTIYQVALYGELQFNTQWFVIFSVISIQISTENNMFLLMRLQLLMSAKLQIIQHTPLCRSGLHTVEKAFFLSIPPPVVVLLMSCQHSGRGFCM